MLPKANVSPPIYQDRKFRSIKTLKKNLKKDYDVINENKYVPFISERNGLGEIKNGYSPIKKDEKRRLLRKFNKEKMLRKKYFNSSIPLNPEEDLFDKMPDSLVDL